jgi:hypothetical protein
MGRVLPIEQHFENGWAGFCPLSRVFENGWAGFCPLGSILKMDGQGSAHWAGFQKIDGQVTLCPYLTLYNRVKFLRFNPHYLFCPYGQTNGQ